MSVGLAGTTRPHRASGLLLFLLAGTLAGLPSEPVSAQGVSIGTSNFFQLQATASPLENCQPLRQLLASITDGSATNRYLVRLEPGTYDCGTESLLIPPGVTIAGFGIELTVIQGDIDSPIGGVLHMHTWTGLRSLRVVNTHSQSGIAVSAWSLVAPTPSATFEDVHLGSFSGSTFRSVYALDAALTIRNSYLPAGVDSTSPSDLFHCEYSRLGSISVTGSPVRCVVCTNAALVILDPDCGPF